MDIEKIINKAEEKASLASEKYQGATYQELLRYFLQSEIDVRDEPESAIVPSNSNPSRQSRHNELPKAYLIAQHGDFKQQLAWALLRLKEKGEEGNVKNVRDMIDLELSLKRPSRSHTSSTLAKLVPRYLNRRKPESGKGYIYFPNANTMSIFEELSNAD